MSCMRALVPRMDDEAPEDGCTTSMHNKAQAYGDAYTTSRQLCRTSMESKHASKTRHQFDAADAGLGFRV
jgi:hypothetical protein